MIMEEEYCGCKSCDALWDVILGLTAERDNLRQQLAESKQDSIDECICKGNWRNIVKESEPLFGRKFMRKGVGWTFYGVVHADDDYYYGMSTGKEHTLLSCVGSIENFGFTLIDKVISKDK